MFQELSIFCLGFAAGYYFKVDKTKIIYNGLNVITMLNQWYSDVKNYFTVDYLIKGVVYYENGEYKVLNDYDFDITESGIHSFKELLPLPLIINYNYKKVNYMLKLRNAQSIQDVQFKSNGKSIKKLLSVNVDGKEVLPDLKIFAGPYENFYCLPEVTFEDIFPGCEKIEIINEFGDLETFRGNVNIISLI